MNGFCLDESGTEIALNESVTDETDPSINSVQDDEVNDGDDESDMAFESELNEKRAANVSQRSSSI